MNNRKILLTVTGIALAVVLLSVGCKMEVNDPLREIPIVSPYISVHPRSATYNVQAGAYAGYDTLSVEAKEWNNWDGTLSYQWYSFADMNAYCTAPIGGTPIPGATNRTYRPALVQTAGSVYYFYVVITNDFPTGTEEGPEGKRKTITSNIAIISFHNNSQAPHPVITRYPTNASYVIGRATTVNPLEIRATGANITYQWYKSSTYSVTGGTLIEDAESASFVPDINTLVKGDNYFYVVVTNTVMISGNRRTATASSLPVNIFMAVGEKAATPRITLQPKDQMIFDDDNPDDLELTVAATSPDNGAITYQWYSVDKPALLDRLDPDPIVETKIGTPVTATTFKPPVPGNAATPAYYFVEVINYNEDVLEQYTYEDGEDDDGEPIKIIVDTWKDDTATVRSKIITVKLASSGTQYTPGMATITIPDDYNVPGSPSRQQYIRGYGGMDVAWANFPATTEAETELQYNPDWGLGYNILRIMIVPPGSQQGNFTNHKDIIEGRPGGEGGWNGLIPNHRPAYIRNVQVVNKYNGYVLASPWTPPKEWKTNNSINSGGILMPSNYQSFANYLRSFAQYMYYKDAPIYAISIANEPNYSGGYDGCEWSQDECVAFFKKVGQFTQGVRGQGGGKSIPRVLIVNGESANTPEYNKEVLNTPESRNVVDFYARHVYGWQLKQLWENAYADWQQGSPYQTECWMTEHNINSANPIAFPDDYTWPFVWRFMNDVDLVIRRNNENAFVWWASKRFYSMIGDGQYECTEGQVLPRGYGLSHYAKYSNDTWRINVDVKGTIYPASGPGVDILTGFKEEVVDEKTVRTEGNVNAVPTTFSLDLLDARVSAFVSPDGNEISLVIFTPTMTNGTGGWDFRRLEIKMPAGCESGSVKAVKSWGEEENELMRPYDVTVNSDRDKAYVTVNRSQILSVKFTKR
jgi:O-glycosyl hydrolase